MSSSPDADRATVPAPATAPDAAGTLPTRTPGGLPTRRAAAGQPSGRHRRPSAPELPEGAVPLLLAVPGADRAGLAALTAEIGLLTRAGLPGLDVRPVLLGAEGMVLDAAPVEGGGPAAVVVPLILGPDDPTVAAVEAAVAVAAVPLTVTEPLGPHPALAEALHERLSEAGLARADRARLFTIVTAAEAVVLAVAGGPEAVRAAEVTGVLLAARLALPVVAVSLTDNQGLSAAASKLREMGANTIAVAPYTIGVEADADLIVDAAERVGGTACAPIGAHPALGRLIVDRYLGAIA